jgi:hypothetical protein
MTDDGNYWKPTPRLRWVKKPGTSFWGPRASPSIWLEQEHVWSPSDEGWGGATKWVRIPVVNFEDAGQCDDPTVEKADD